MKPAAWIVVSLFALTLIAAPASEGDAVWARLMYWSTSAVLAGLIVRRVWLTRVVAQR